MRHTLAPSLGRQHNSGEVCANATIRHKLGLKLVNVVCKPGGNDTLGARGRPQSSSTKMVILV
jgi:hypothetical protein